MKSNSNKIAKHIKCARSRLSVHRLCIDWPRNDRTKVILCTHARAAWAGLVFYKSKFIPSHPRGMQMSTHTYRCSLAIWPIIDRQFQYGLVIWPIIDRQFHYGQVTQPQPLPFDQSEIDSFTKAKVPNRSNCNSTNQRLPVPRDTAWRGEPTPSRRAFAVAISVHKGLHLGEYVWHLGIQ